MRIALGSDHAGFRFKQRLRRYLAARGHAVTDFGALSEDPVDYPLFVRRVARSVSLGRYDRGIVVGGSGNGEAIAALDAPIRGLRPAAPKRPGGRFRRRARRAR
ncbi:MAG: RpiB/LacA/LacB family sugar-phosphate isomerase [Planctomycetota bacterium]